MNAIEFRKSVRNFQSLPLRDEDVKIIQSYINNSKNLIGPHGNECKIKVLLDSELNKNGKMGTYGVIQNAQGYILGSCNNDPEAVFDFAYVLEGLVLELTNSNIGTCWLGGTFNRSEFDKYYPRSNGDIIPAITPIGYAKDNMHFRERMTRQSIKADQRKTPDQLFFYGDFKNTLKNRARRYIRAMKYIRLAPSARNNQPWRILVSSDFSKVHFYIFKELEHERCFTCAPEYLDIGIAYRHFIEGMTEEGLPGELIVDNPKVGISSDMEYIASWVKA